MAFVSSRKHVGFFGIMNGENIDFFSENSSSADSGFQCDVLTLNDKFPLNVDLPSKNVCVEKDDDIQITFISASISDCGQFIAATDSKKYVFLWKREHEKWHPVSRRSLLRRAYKVMFTRKGSEVVVADKGGDLFTFSVVDASENGKLILGHISIVLDMAMTEGDRYIITSDRDGKIRVSHYPNCYNVFTYCLGHEEFVCAVQLLGSSLELLVSSAGDGTLKLWDYGLGKQLFSYELNSDFVKPSILQSNSGAHNATEDSKLTGPLSKTVKVLRYCSKLDIIITLFYNSPTIVILRLNDSTLEHIQSLSLKCVPIDAYFSGDNTLWVVLSSELPAVVSFRCVTTASALQFVETTQAADNALASEMNDKLSLSKLSLAHQMNFTNLLNQCISFTMHNVETCNDEPNKKINKLAI